MKKVLFLLLIAASCSSVNAQIMFKTEYFGTSAYRMMEGETDEKVGDTVKGRPQSIKGDQYPLVYEVG